MLIDEGRAILVSSAIKATPSEDGGYQVLFVPVQRILDLAKIDPAVRIAGMSWLDIPEQQLIYTSLAKFKQKQCVRWLAAGRCLAVRSKPQRGVKSKGARLDKDGEVVLIYSVTWRNLEKYITDARDQFWLKQYLSLELNMAAVLSMADLIMGLAARMPKRWHRRVRKQNIESSRVVGIEEEVIAVVSSSS